LEALEKDISSIRNINNNEPLRIGKRADWQNLFKGCLDQIRFVNRIITESEIIQLYNETL